MQYKNPFPQTSWFHSTILERVFLKDPILLGRLSFLSLAISILPKDYFSFKENIQSPWKFLIWGEGSKWLLLNEDSGRREAWSAAVSWYRKLKHFQLQSAPLYLIPPPHHPHSDDIHNCQTHPPQLTPKILIVILPVTTYTPMSLSNPCSENIGQKRAKLLADRRLQLFRIESSFLNNKM